MNPIRLVVVLSDIHAGSTTALLPPEFKNFEKNPILQNPLQVWLWECWQRNAQWITNIADGEPFVLVINGDLIEGVHHGTKQVVSPEMGDHVAAAFALLNPLREQARSCFVVRGTECHTNNHEQALGDMLGAEMNQDVGKRIFDRLTLDVQGVRCVFRHHIGTTMRRNLAATQFSIALAEEQIEAVNNQEPIPRVVCCAHRHKFGMYEDDNGLLVVTPPWQALTRFGHKVVSAARTKPGTVILDWRKRGHGALPEVHAKIFAAPAPRAIEL